MDYISMKLRTSAFIGICFTLLVNTSYASNRFGTTKSPAASPSSPNAVSALPGTATALAQLLAGPGVPISNATLTGDPSAAGTFSAGLPSIGIDSGVVLSSGRVADVAGPNSAPDTTTDFSTPGDADLDTILTTTTSFDAIVLEFDFVPQGNSTTFSYVFSSEEYNEYVNSSFNDVFAFYVNGVNCALVNGNPVSINSINNGNPFGSLPNSNPQFFVNNESGTLDTEMDGLTTPLQCTASVNPGVTNHIKLAIADADDTSLDSAVFIQAGSIGAPPAATNAMPVPTTGLWGLLLLGGGLFGLGLTAIQRRITRN